VRPTRIADRLAAVRRAAAAAGVAGAAAAFVVAPAISHAQTPVFDRIQELSAKVAAATFASGYTRVALSAADARLYDTLVIQLRSRGVTVDASAATKLFADCGQNLRESVCSAELTNGGTTQVVCVAGPRDALDRSAVVALEVRSIATQRAPMLDVALTGDDIVVLEPRQVTIRRSRETADTVAAAVSLPLPHDQVWPRDLRGRLRVTDSAVSVFLPALSCVGRVRPLSVACSASESSWPLGLDNTGIVGNRNYFLTPEGFAFYGAAPLGASAPEPWLVADREGALTFLDHDRAAVRRDRAADDVVRLEQQCAEGVYVVAVDHVGEGSRGDELHLLRVGEAGLVSVAGWTVGGSVTALWADPGDRAARAIVRTAALDRYEAFRIAIACAR